MRVLFVAHQFFPEHYAGVEIITLGLAKEFRRRGHESFVLAPKRSRPVNEIDPGEVEDYEFEGVPVRRVGRPTEGFGRPYRLDFENETMEKRTREYVQEIQPDVIHAEHFQGLSASVIPVLKEAGVPLVYTATDFWTMCPVVDFRRHDGTMCTGPDLPECMRCIASRYPGSRMKYLVNWTPRFLSRLVGKVAKTRLGDRIHSLGQIRALNERPGFIRERMREVDHVIAYTHLMQGILEKNGIGVGRTRVSPYGIDTSHIKRKNPTEERSGSLKVGFIGTLARHKGCDILLEAVNMMDGVSVNVEIYGNPNEYEDYSQYLRSLASGNESVSFAGSFQREKIGSVIESLDVLVVPSRWYENQPGVILEAFAAGIPVVATDLGGMSEFVHHEKNGLLFDLESPSSLANQLTRLAQEEDLIWRLREGIKTVKTVSDDVDELCELYGSLMTAK